MTGATEEDRAADSTKRHQRTQRLVGLARRAGSIAIGLRSTEKSVRRGHCRLILLAEDASARTSRIVYRSAGRVPVILVKNRHILGGWIGSSPVAVVGITHKEFAKAIKEGDNSAPLSGS